MHTLSPQAQKKRRSDMLALTGDHPDYWYIIRVLVVGFSLLVVQYFIQMAQYTPKQRALLVALSIMAGGALLAFLITYQLVWLALVIAFALGVLISTIAHL